MSAFILTLILGLGRAGLLISESSLLDLGESGGFINI